MGRIEVLLFTLTLFGALAHGAKLGNGVCKNCKTKNAASNSQRLIASPINLLNPDRYEFFTLDDKGKVVKRIMTFKEIQSIVAGSDITELKLFANKNNNDRIVSSVVSNVRNVLNNELNLMNGHDTIDTAEQQLPISDVISSPQEPLGGSSTMYDVLHKLGENLVTLKTTPRPTTTSERTTETSTSTTTTTTTTTTPIPTEDVTSRWMLKTTPKPIINTAQEVEERTTQSTTVKPTTSSTERTTTTTLRSTARPVQQRTTTTVRPTERTTTERPSVRSTEKTTVTKTTSLPSTTVSTTSSTTTELPTTTTTTTTTTTSTTTVPPVKQSALRRSTTTTSTTTAMPTTEAQMIKWSAASLASVRSTESPVLKSSSPSTTTTEAPPMFKEAQPSTVTVRSTVTTTPKTSTVSSTTEASTTKTTSQQPPVKTSTTVMKPTEQSIEHSSHRSEEVSESANFVEYSTEQSSEKWDDSSSSEATTYTTSEEESSETASTGLLITKLNDMIPQSVAMELSTVKAPDSATTGSVAQASTSAVSTQQDKVSEELDSLKDLESSEESENDSNEEVIETTTSFSTWFTDPIGLSQNKPNDTIFKETNIAFNETLDQSTVTMENTQLDNTFTTPTSSELDSSTAEDSFNISEEQESDEAPSTSLNLDSQETTTAVAATAEDGPSDDDGTDYFQTDSEQSVLQDTSTIPTDAQHAIHKIIESLQSINDDSASDETEEANSQETGNTEDIPGMNYDTDAQSSINAIIQSLGQGALGVNEGGIFSIATTTDMIATAEPTTVTQEPVKSNPSTKANIATERIAVSTSTPLSTSTLKVSVLKTSKPDAGSTETVSTGTFNYNTNIMDTIEKFLSSFGSLPKENSYSANLTELNILGDYPAEINMTDYVDRTATVASVLKFPQTASLEEVADQSAIGTSEAESSLEDAPVTIEPDMSIADQPILSETVASFMKLGEMLTMGTRISSTEENPTPVQQLEVKTAIDEEETELLRFLSICSTLGTNVYDYLLTGSQSNEGRSMLNGQSLVYSPFATLTTLSMLFLGTRGTTAESINGVIGLDEMTSFNPHLFFKTVAEDLKQKYRRTYGRENDEQGSSFARTLLSDESRGGLQRFFKARIQEIYSTVAETVDFRQKDMLLRHMNGDFPRDYVDTLKQMRSPLVSISRNRYRHECNPAATNYGTMQFVPSVQRSASPVTLPSVSFRSGFSTGFSKALDATILALPGSTSNVSVFFLKPSAGSDVSALETHLRNQSISNVLKLFPDETVRSAYTEVQLPYFTQTTIYNMTQSIQHLGLQNLFEPNVANFNGLQDSATSNLYLSEVIQTDSFSLCGGGEGEALRMLPLRSFSTNLVKYSAALPMDRADSSKGVRRNRRKLAYRNRSVFDAQQMQDSKLVFDTPFLYLVRHNPTGMVLYMGRFIG